VRTGRAKLLLAAVIGGIAVAAAVVAGILNSGKTATRPERSGESLRRCVALWNGPGNARQRSALNAAALAGPSVTATNPGSAQVADRVLVLRYRGPPVEDVGVGGPRVDATWGDCVVAHPSNILFLYTRRAWHNIGYSPGLAFKGIPERATKSPNGVTTVRRPAAQRAEEPGMIALTR
jgi:hypothetical protein